MKKIMFFLIALASTVGCSMASSAGTGEHTHATTSAAALGQDRGGGDAGDILDSLTAKRRAELTKKLNFAITSGLLKSQIIGFTMDSYSEFKDPAMSQIYADLKQRGIKEDIDASDYVIKSECIDKDGKRHTATSIDNSNPDVMNAKFDRSICIDVNLIVEKLGFYIPDSVLMGLMYHEHVRHFGYKDTDHSFARAVAENIQQWVDNYDASHGTRGDGIIQ